jgi:nifR3 family TIM-barrel protein
MAGYTDHGMRTVCRAAGAELLVSEMISAKAVCYNDKKTESLARLYESDGPTLIQLFGHEPPILKEAARRLYESAQGGILPIGFDVNMGCPVRKIVSGGDGSALMEHPPLIEAIVRALVDAIPLPVSVKLRAGIDRSHRNAVECALAAEAGGAAFVAIHGRTRSEMYSGRADREIIKNVKNALHIPVIANGDVACGQDALEILCDTGCDGIMVGRAAIGNPFLFTEILCALQGRPYSFPTAEQRVATAKEQLAYSVEHLGEELAVREGRKQIALYLRACPGAAALRAAIHAATTVAQMHAALDSALKTQTPSTAFCANP